MAELEQTGRGAQRVSHEDRDQVAEALRVAAGDGRLSADELDDRLEKALTARTYDDLAALVTDPPQAGTAPPPRATALPQAGTALAAGPGALAAAPAKDLMKIQVTSGKGERVGRWTVP